MTVVQDREAYIAWMVELTGLSRIVLSAMNYADGQKIAAAVRKALGHFRDVGKSQSAPTTS
jgi:hypothetical protein